jgi:hypothetical protein
VKVLYLVDACSADARSSRWYEATLFTMKSMTSLSQKWDVVRWNWWAVGASGRDSAV